MYIIYISLTIVLAKRTRSNSVLLEGADARSTAAVVGEFARTGLAPLVSNCLLRRGGYTAALPEATIVTRLILEAFFLYDSSWQNNFATFDAKTRPLLHDYFRDDDDDEDD